MAHLGKYSRSTWGIFKHDPGERPKWQLYKIWNEEIGYHRNLHLNYNLHETKRWTFWLWFCKNRAMEFLGKNVRKREDINCGVVAGYYVTREPTSVLRGWQTQIFEVCHDFLGKRYGFDNIVGAYVHMDEKQPHTCTQNHSSHLWRKENKYRHSPRDMFNRTDLKLSHKDWSVRLERESGLTWGVYENKREDERLA